MFRLRAWPGACHIFLTFCILSMIASCFHDSTALTASTASVLDLFECKETVLNLHKSKRPMVALHVQGSLCTRTQVPTR